MGLKVVLAAFGVARLREFIAAIVVGIAGIKAARIAAGDAQLKYEMSRCLL
jgi:hypothetical protein